jgi:hypothetical protein
MLNFMVRVVRNSEVNCQLELRHHGYFYVENFFRVAVVRLADITVDIGSNVRIHYYGEAIT